MPVDIRDAAAGDGAALVAIYNHYVANTTISFEEAPVTAADMAERIGAVQQGALPWLVACDDRMVLGYAYATKWRVRHAYRFAVECSVYLHPDMARRGLGEQLYRALFARLRAGGYHRAIGGIALPNPASVGLHEKLGFRKVAHFGEVGFKFGQWIDVGYWELRLDSNGDSEQQ